RAWRAPYCVRSRGARSGARTLPGPRSTECPPRSSKFLYEAPRMLQVRNVRKVYDGRTVVNDVSFDVAAGEIFALLGPNGAGKTTLIRMITDIVRPDGGTITFDGRAVGGPDRPRMAYLPEERGLYKKVPVPDA